MQRQRSYTNIVILFGKVSHKTYAVSCLFITMQELPKQPKGGIKDTIVVRKRGNGPVLQHPGL